MTRPSTPAYLSSLALASLPPRAPSVLSAAAHLATSQGRPGSPGPLQTASGLSRPRPVPHRPERHSRDWSETSDARDVWRPPDSPALFPPAPGASWPFPWHRASFPTAWQWPCPRRLRSAPGRRR
eukprot:scaffold2191_cov254-Pinguiococcus_pyrenoidosus.AAC.32